MGRIITCLICLIIAGDSVISQETSDIDLSRYQIVDEDLTIKKLSEIQNMETNYNKLIATGDCNEAIPAIVSFYNAANMAANLLTQGLEPFYDADRDERETIAILNEKLFNELLAAERKANDLKQQRNRAWVEEAKCLLMTGEKNKAVNRLYRALDYIDNENKDLWEEARMLLWKEIGY